MSQPSLYQNSDTPIRGDPQSPSEIDVPIESYQSSTRHQSTHHDSYPGKNNESTSLYQSSSSPVANYSPDENQVQEENPFTASYTFIPVTATESEIQRWTYSSMHTETSPDHFLGCWPRDFTEHHMLLLSNKRIIHSLHNPTCKLSTSVSIEDVETIRTIKYSGTSHFDSRIFLAAICLVMTFIEFIHLSVGLFSHVANDQQAFWVFMSMFVRILIQIYLIVILLSVLRRFVSSFTRIVPSLVGLIVTMVFGILNILPLSLYAAFQGFYAWTTINYIIMFIALCVTTLAWPTLVRDSFEGLILYTNTKNAPKKSWISWMFTRGCFPTTRLSMEQQPFEIRMPISTAEAKQFEKRFYSTRESLTGENEGY